jgi:CHAT domain-containing protein/Tfp pilus assembly protein PilF
MPVLAAAVVLIAAPAADPDEDAVKAAVGKFFDAYGKQDLDVLADCLGASFRTPLVPTRAAFLGRMKQTFAKLDPAKYEVTVLRASKLPTGKAVARVQFRGEPRVKGTTTTNDDEGDWTIMLAREGGVWKFDQLADSGTVAVGIASRMKTKAERVAFFRAEGDRFLKDRVLRPLFDEQGQAIEAGEFGRVEVFQELAEAATEALTDKDDRELNEGLCLLGRSRNELVMEQYDAAAEASKRALALYREKGWKMFEVSVYVNLVAAQYKQGDYRGALATGEEARKTVAGFNELARMLVEVKLLGNLGLVYAEMGDYPRAEKDLAESLRLAEKYGDAAAARNARLNLATLRQHQGKLAEAARIYEGVLGDARRVGNRRMEAGVLNNLGLVRADQGRVGQAIQNLEDARKLSAALNDRRGQALALGNLGLVHGRVGNDEDAARYYAQARKLFEVVGDKAGLARCARAEAMDALFAGRREEAEATAARYLAAVQAGGSKSQLAEALFTLGIMYAQTGRPAPAAEALDGAARLFRELGDEFREMLTRVYRMVERRPDGTLLLDVARTAALRKDVDRLDDPRVTSHYYEALARLALHEKDWGKAAADLRTAIAVAERSVGALDDPLLAASAKGGRLNNLYSYLTVSLAAGGKPAEAFQAAERGRSRALIETLERGGTSVVKGMAVAERAEEDRLRAEVARFTHLANSTMRFASADTAARDKIKGQLAEAQATYEAFRRRMNVAHPDLPAQRGEFPGVDLVGLNKTLFAAEPDVAVLSYVATMDRVLLLVITAGEPGGPAKVTVFETPVKDKDLADAAAEFWRACQNPRAGRPDGTALYKWLVAPAREDLGGKKHLVVVPCYPLLTLPFHALRDAEGPYLVEEFAVSYVPSVAALLEMRKLGDRVRKAGAGRPVVAVGGVVFTPDLKDLPASGPEAEAVARAFGKAEVLRGAAATRAAVTRDATPARILHLATHGLVNDTRPLFSAVAVAPAGADDDGRLYAHDVAALDLTAEMVVLSACETARGKEYRGEGTVGLAWAFVVAGAPAVVVSQWSVADEATAALMESFHRRVAAGADWDRAESLRQAQLGLLRDRRTRHPFYWAPFVFTGDWRD